MNFPIKANDVIEVLFAMNIAVFDWKYFSVFFTCKVQTSEKEVHKEPKKILK